jgi:hypothetical protein
MLSKLRGALNFLGLLAELNAFAAHTGKQWIGGHRQQASIFH